MKTKTTLTILFIVGLSFRTFAQTADDWIHYGDKQFGKVTFNLYAKRGSWGMGQQFFGANFYNGTSYKIRVEGELYAQLICGNEATSSFSFNVESYSEKKKIEPSSQNNGTLSDNTGLIGSADKELCQGNEITVYHYWGNEKKIGKTHTRINALGVRKLKLIAIQSDGSEVPITNNGELINTETNKRQTSQNQNASSTINSQTQNQNVNSNDQNSNYQEQQRQQQESEQNRQRAEEQRQQQEIERQRKEQIERINEANRRTAENNQHVFDGIANIGDILIQNSFRNNIQNENNKRQTKFDQLQELIKTKNGNIVNCTHCNGMGYNTCSSCSGEGKKTCSYCAGQGKTIHAFCGGTGQFNGNTCSVCGGVGSISCAACKGSGNMYCTDCNAIGKSFCSFCDGTGQEFKGESNSMNNYNTATSNSQSNNYSQSLPNITSSPHLEVNFIDGLNGLSVRAPLSSFRKLLGDAEETSGSYDFLILNYRSKGLFMISQKDTVYSITYSFLNKKFTPFNGTIQGGVNSNSNFDDIVNKFGQPDNIETEILQEGSYKGSTRKCYVYSGFGAKFFFYDNKLASINQFRPKK